MIPSLRPGFRYLDQLDSWYFVFRKARGMVIALVKVLHIKVRLSHQVGPHRGTVRRGIRGDRVVQFCCNLKYLKLC